MRFSPGLLRKVLRNGALLILLAAGPGVSAQVAAPAPGEGFDVSRYDVVLRPDLMDRSLSGHTRIHLRTTASALRSLSFSPNALEVVSAAVNGRVVSVRRTDAALTFDLAEVAPRGRRLVLDVQHRGRPTRGVTFGDGSIRASYWACDWMICLQDSPGDKAAFALDLRLPEGRASLAPGVLRSSRPAASGEIVHSWRQDEPRSPYLFGFAAGVFTEVRQTVGGVRLTYLGEGASAEELTRLFAPTADMLDFFQSRAGVPLPGGRYTQLLTPGSEAQEAAGFALIGRANIAPILETPQEDWVIAHELAHQWWGNSVTCSDWSEFWLNEGVTTFMVAAWKEHRWGRPAYDRELDLARRRLATAAAAGFDVPLSYQGPYPSLGVRRAVQYSKGALFMDALRTEIGERAFWEGLRGYTRRHVGGVVTSRDLQRAFEHASGRDLQPLFMRWVYGSAAVGSTPPSA